MTAAPRSRRLPGLLPALARATARRWARLSLAARFGLAAFAVLLPASLAIGAFVASRIEQAVVRNAGQATALLMDSVISPVSQQFGQTGELSPGARRALEEILGGTALGERVAAFKFWDPTGLVVWSDVEGAAGQRFPVTDDLGRALAGEVVASFDDLGDAEDADEAAMGLPLLEIYSPVRAVWSGEVIAVAEFYEIAPSLARDLRAAQLAAYALVGLLTLGLGGILTVIVRGGSRTIEAQRAALDANVADLRELSTRNRELRLRVQAAAARASAGADRTLRALGADLHDGPAQQLAYAALRLDALRARLDGDPAGADLGRVQQAVADAMAEIRQISRGLQLPDLAGKPLADIVRDACAAHEGRSGHAVALHVAGEPPPVLAPGLKLCVLRFVQETLANASRHAGGAGLEVALACAPGELVVATRDRGPGLPDDPRAGALGLAGLRDRVESLGGAFRAGPRPGGGAEIAMTLDPGGPA